LRICLLIELILLSIERIHHLNQIVTKVDYQVILKLVETHQERDPIMELQIVEQLSLELSVSLPYSCTMTKFKEPVKSHI